MAGDSVNELEIQRQLMKYAEDMSILYQKLKESEKRADKIDLFTRSIVHDLKNLTIGAYGFTKLLNKRYRNLLDRKGKTFLDRILESSAQSTTLVEKINSYTHSQKAPLSIEAVHLKDILQTVKNEYSDKLTSRQIKLTEPATLSVIHADRLSILRIMRNLIDNALKYGGDALSEIAIGYVDSDEFHIISVRDDGIGIDGNEAKKIFDKFYRNESSGKIEGLGLGLAIVKGLAKRHKGKAWIEPCAEKGVTFYISIHKSLSHLSKGDNFAAGKDRERKIL